MSKFLTYTAVYVLLEKNGQFWLMRRANTGYRDGQYSLPAGHLEEGETLLQAAVREVKEETGLDVAPGDLEQVYVLFRQNPDHTYNDYFFVCQRWDGEPTNTEPEKCDDANWFEQNRLPAGLVPEVAKALHALAHNEKFGQLDLRKEKYRDAAN